MKAFSDLIDRHQRRRVGEYRSNIFTSVSARNLSKLDQGAILHRLADERLYGKETLHSRSPKELRFYVLIQSYTGGRRRMKKSEFYQCSGLLRYSQGRKNHSPALLQVCDDTSSST